MNIVGGPHPSTKRSLCVNLVMKTLCQFQVYDKMVIKERDTLKLAEISIFVLVTVKKKSYPVLETVISQKQRSKEKDVLRQNVINVCHV